MVYYDNKPFSCLIFDEALQPVRCPWILQPVTVVNHLKMMGDYLNLIVFLEVYEEFDLHLHFHFQFFALVVIQTYPHYHYY